MFVFVSCYAHMEMHNIKKGLGLRLVKISTKATLRVKLSYSFRIFEIIIKNKSIYVQKK